MSMTTLRKGLCLALITCICIAGSAAEASSQDSNTSQTVDISAEAHRDGRQPDRQRTQHKHHGKRHRPSHGPDVDTPFRWSARNIAAAAGIAVSAMLANAAGLGGGPLFVTILSTVVGMDLKLVPGLSHTIITSGAVAAFAFGLVRRSPVNGNKTLLNFDIALTLVPAILFGASFGVLVGPLVPEWLQTALLAALLAFVVRRTLAKGLAQLRKEQEGQQPAPPPAARREAWAGSTENSVQEPLLGGSIGQRASLEGRTAADAAMSAAESAAAAASETATVRAGFLQRVPWAKVAALLALWAAFVVLQLLESRHGHCTWAFAALAAMQALLLASAAAAYMFYQSIKAVRDPGSVDFELQKLMTLPNGSGSITSSSRGDGNGLMSIAAAVAAAGFIAGFLGLGGAVVFDPLLVDAGVQPQTAAATSMLIVLFGSSSIMLTFMFHHSLNLSYAAAFAPIACCSSLLGVTFVGWAIRKSGRTSIVILLTAGVIAIGATATILFGGLQAWHDLQHGGHGFRSFCSA